LIPLDYRSEQVLEEHERIWAPLRPGWRWPRRHPLTAEYSWVCDRLAEHLQCRPNEARVMDAGGGQGSMQHYLAEHYRMAWNVDVDPLCIHGQTSEALLLKADLENLGSVPSLIPGTFDGIVAVSSIEHNPWRKILRIVRELLGMLREGAPLVVTVPAFEHRTYYPPGGWPDPWQAWPECYLFDGDAFRELVQSVEDVSDLVGPAILDGEFYRREWRWLHADARENSPVECRRPYLSLGFVLRRRTGNVED